MELPCPPQLIGVWELGNPYTRDSGKWFAIYIVTSGMDLLACSTFPHLVKILKGFGSWRATNAMQPIVQATLQPSLWIGSAGEGSGEGSGDRWTTARSA